MNSYNKVPIFRNKLTIQGPCLFLIGPIGTFFARLSNFLEKNDVRTYKILFPLHEYGFPKSRIIKYSDKVDFFKDFLRAIIIKHDIKHIFMYGNVIIPHRQALELVSEFSKRGEIIQTHIFELGYLRPNFVTLESSGVNYKSKFILNKEFYSKQEPYKTYPVAKKHKLRIRKFWKAITFINHALKNHQIVEFDHKLQPKVSYLWFQTKGFFLKYYFRLVEYNLKKKCLFVNPFFLVILQVSTDSQVTQGSKIKNNREFIYKVIEEFACAKLKKVYLVFKHHPRDRGYNDYSKDIKEIAEEFQVSNNVFYIHDYFLSNIFTNPNCKGTVLINSTVGFQALYHSIPVKALGISPYNIDGLSSQKSLIYFFLKPDKVDKLLFQKFYKYILENSQINGNFDGFFPFSDVFSFENNQN